MPRKDNKSRYTDKQKRMAKHIADGYVEQGVGTKRAKARAWATVNKITGGARKPGGSGRGMSESEERRRRSEAAKRGWNTRRAAS